MFKILFATIPAGIRRYVFAPLVPVLVFAGCAHRGDVARSGEIQNIELVSGTKSWDGTKLPPYPRGQPEVTVRRFVIPPGASLPMHKHPVINAGVLIRGNLEVVKKGGPTKTLKAGDALIEMVDLWHYGRNPGRVPAEIVVVYAGTPGVPTSVLH